MKRDVSTVRRRTAIGALLVLTLLAALFAGVAYREILAEVDARIAERRTELRERIRLTVDAFDREVSVLEDEARSADAAELFALTETDDLVRLPFRLDADRIAAPRKPDDASLDAAPWVVPATAPSLRSLRERIDRWRTEGRADRCIEAIDQLLARSDIESGVRMEATLLRSVIQLESDDAIEPPDDAIATVEKAAPDGDEGFVWLLTARLRLAGALQENGRADEATALLLRNVESLIGGDTWFRLGPAVEFHQRETLRRLSSADLDAAAGVRRDAATDAIARYEAEARSRQSLDEATVARLRLVAAASADGRARIDLEPLPGAEDRRTFVLTRDGTRIDGFELASDAVRNRIEAGLPRSAVLAPRRESTTRRAIADASPEVLEEPIAAGLPFVARLDLADELARYRVRRGLFYAAVFGLAWLAIAGAAFATWRGVIRQAELAHARSEFVANVSHELKTPLTLIRMFTDLLREGYAHREEERDRALDIIGREAGSLTLLIDNILEVTRMDRGDDRIHAEVEDPEPLLREVLEEMRPILEQKGFLVAERIEAALPQVAVDRASFARALRNLLANAVKYSPERREIEIGAAKRDGRVAFEVADRGVGLPEGEESRIFERYHRALATSRERAIAGTGLGLAIVRRFAEMHGGRAFAKRREGGGSRFVVEVPIAATSAEASS